MKNRLFFWAICAVLLPGLAAGADFTLTSPEFSDGGRLAEAHSYNGFGCSGQNRSPALQWSGAPTGTRSYALLVHDPDAPIASGWWHWLLVNIPASATSLPAGAGDPAANEAPAGSQQIRTSFGSTGYGGPCPPPGHGDHRYNFVLYALGVEQLELPADATAELAAFMVESNALGRARLTGRYSR